MRCYVLSFLTFQNVNVIVNQSIQRHGAEQVLDLDSAQSFIKHLVARGELANVGRGPVVHQDTEVGGSRERLHDIIHIVVATPVLQIKENGNGGSATQGQVLLQFRRHQYTPGRHFRHKKFGINLVQAKRTILVMNISEAFATSMFLAFKKRSRYSSACLLGTRTEATFSFISPISYARGVQVKAS